MEKNVGLFNESFPPVMDGVAVCVENYAHWIQEKVGGVSVVTPRKLGAHYGQYPYEVLDYASVPVPFRHPYVTGIAQIDPLLRAKLRRRNFKIVHAHSPFSAGLMALQVAHSQHIPLVATFHSKFKDDFREVIPSDMVVDQAIKIVMEFFDHADEVWVPQASVEEARRALGIAPGEFVFLFVGQHIWQKNVRLVIDALEKIKDLPFRMFFVGTGYAAGEMKELVEQKGLSDKVTFTGMLTERAQVTRYYAAADLFLFPSLYDNAPLVVREAAALHTPAVMVEGSTAATILRDGENGYLVPNDLDAFAARLRELYRDRAAVRRTGLAASRTIVRSWEDVVGEVLDRYNALIARKTRIRPLK